MSLNSTIVLQYYYQIKWILNNTLIDRKLFGVVLYNKLRKFHRK